MPCIEEPHGDPSHRLELITYARASADWIVGLLTEMARYPFAHRSGFAIGDISPVPGECLCSASPQRGGSAITSGMNAPVKTAAKSEALRLAAAHGHVICRAPGAKDDRPNVIAGTTFAALAKAGLLTHDVNGCPEPRFFAWVEGTVGYLTAAGAAGL